jgi:putative flippase GtrA
MKLNWQKLWKLFLLKAKFATTSLVATVVDLSIFWVLDNYFFPQQVLISTVISSGCGMVVNFLLQKRFVFTLTDSVSRTFLLAILVSLGGIALNAAIVVGLTQFAFFDAHRLLAKICAIGIVFFYNFYLKRYVFERKFI